MRRLVKNDLGMKSRAVVTKNRINPNQMGRRKERCKGILNWLKQGANKETVLIFSDEKLFHVDPMLNRRNVRYISDLPHTEVSSDIKYNPRTKHAAKVMVLGVVASDGQKCPPIFVGENEKINAEAYQGLLRAHVLPWLADTYPSGNYCWTQDGAPAHTARTTQRLLGEEMSEFWGSEFWPPSAPELNPLDYSIWSYLQEKACNKTHSSVTALKRSILAAWDSMSDEYIRKVCSTFRRRVQAVVDADGGFIE